MLSNMGVAIDDAALESITKPKEEVSQTTSTTQTEIESKKADVKKDRYYNSQANRMVRVQKESQNTDVIQEEIDEIETIIEKAKELGWDKNRLFRQLTSMGYSYALGVNPEAFRNYLEDRLSGKTNIKVTNEYNFFKQLDAELKALEDSSKSIENVIQEASEPQPLESAEVNELSELNTKASELRVKIKKLRKSKANITEIAKANEELVNIQNNIAKLSNNGNNIGTMQSDEAREEAFEIASLELQRMLNVTPSRMNNLISKFGSNPRLVGAVYRGAVYLADMMPKGTAYHEAFHYVFRTFLTDKEINKIINYAKSKYPKPTAKQ